MAPNLDMRWQDQTIVKKNGQWTVDGRPSVTATLISQNAPSNLPNHYYLGLRVIAPQNSATPPHTHGGAAVNATMIRGQMLNQMVCPDHEAESQGTGAKVYNVGESWYEMPECHHVRSENVGEEEAEFVAWFVVERGFVDRDGLAALIVVDAEVEARED